MTKPSDEKSKTASPAEKIFEKVDKARTKRRLPRVRVGFAYAKAIRCISADYDYSLSEIADCIGCTQANVQRMLKIGSIPGHITGELLWGLCIDHYGKEKTYELFLTAEQRKGPSIGRVAKRHRISQ